jgi:hypothetical protein
MWSVRDNKRERVKEQNQPEMETTLSFSQNLNVSTNCFSSKKRDRKNRRPVKHVQQCGLERHVEV